MTLSSFTWLDYDAREAQRAAELISALSDKETVDSIGIGSVRDGLADLLFPGTSTIITRARYFLFVPWAMKQVADRRPRSRTQFDDWLKQVEVDTLRALVAGNAPDAWGIVGRRRGERTKRWPSSVYWGPLGEWRIRVSADLSMRSYREFAVKGRHRLERLADESSDTDIYQVWDELPDAPSEFPGAELGILPTAEEAGYLLRKMAGTRAGGRSTGNRLPSDQPSLLARVALSPRAAQVDEPWMVPTAVGTELLRSATDYAQGFSLVIQGARLRYNKLLCDALRQRGYTAPDTEGRLDQHIGTWVSRMAGRSVFIAAWMRSLGELFALLERSGARVPHETRGFIQRWAERAVADPESAMRSVDGGSLIIAREAYLKGGAARLTNESPLRQWDGALFGENYLDFRWAAARALVNDCVSRDWLPNARPR